MSEYYHTICSDCNKGLEDEHVVLHDNKTCSDCHEKIMKVPSAEEFQSCDANDSKDCQGCGHTLDDSYYEYPEGDFCQTCHRKIVLNEDDEIFGKETEQLCDSCGGSIDANSIQFYSPNIFCPDCLKGIQEAEVTRKKLDFMDNINKIAECLPLILEKLNEIEKNTNKTS